MRGMEDEPSQTDLRDGDTEAMAERDCHEIRSARANESPVPAQLEDRTCSTQDARLPI